MTLPRDHDLPHAFSFHEAVGCPHPAAGQMHPLRNGPFGPVSPAPPFRNAADPDRLLPPDTNRLRSGGAPAAGWRTGMSHTYPVGIGSFALAERCR